MKYVIAAVIFIAVCSNAVADQIDYFCLFANQASAQADATVGRYWTGTNWRGDVTFPGLSVVSSQAIVNGISSVTGFWIVISGVGNNAALDADPNCYMTLDRDKIIIVATALTAAGHQSFRFSPVPFGSQYPSPLGQ